MNKTIKKSLKILLKPVYPRFVDAKKKIETKYYRQHPVLLADKIFFRCFGRHINWNDPQDLNEKINWLKFHADPYEWADLADKYKVREYVKSCGLEEILKPLIGKWDTVEDFFADWDSLPDEFALKSNNGSGRVVIVSKESGGKEAINREALSKTLHEWLHENDYGLDTAELHYSLIQNCILAEELIRDERLTGSEVTTIENKIWCFNGKPFIIYVPRDVGSINYRDYYDLEWIRRPDLLKYPNLKPTLPKPDDFERELEIASILSKNHPIVRVDLYNLHGKIYFGEMTMTGTGGYMAYFTDEAAYALGQQVELDLGMPLNMFGSRADMDKCK